MTDRERAESLAPNQSSVFGFHSRGQWIAKMEEALAAVRQEERALALRRAAESAKPSLEEIARSHDSIPAYPPGYPLGEAGDLPRRHDPGASLSLNRRVAALEELSDNLRSRLAVLESRPACFASGSPQGR